MKDIKIIEFKARCADHAPARDILEQKGARYVGEDHQVDTYFNVPAGRLKLREGSIERKLIFYQRADQAGPKLSDVMLFPVEKISSKALRLLLTKALGIKVVVDKRRHIYFIDNIKIHLDHVKGLGSFLEVEAIDTEGLRSVEELDEQCNALKILFGVSDNDLISHSYSDMG
ncbi:MAG: class IV adenylate cyclase [Rhodothermales bacterium]